MTKKQVWVWIEICLLAIMTVSLLDLMACAKSSRTPITIIRSPTEQALIRASEFHHALETKNTKKAWELLAPIVKEEFSESDYREKLSLMLGSVKLKFGKPSVVSLGEKYAIVQYNLNIAIHDHDDLRNGLESRECFRMLLLRYSDNWYVVEAGYDCTYVPSPDYIDFLTKNLP